MLPTVFTIPLPGGAEIPIKGYGLMMMIGFLSAIYLIMRRAQKVRCDPDVVLNAGFLALICGVFGARIFYVVHYWEAQFKIRGVWAAFDVTSGGLEFYGGFLAAVTAIVIYLRIKGHSVRLFLDIMAPGVMWGLAFGRLGCMLNGCCFGGTCPSHFPWPLAITFPYGSPGFIHHFQENRTALPRELMYMDAFGLVRPISRDHIAMTTDEIAKARNDHRKASEALMASLNELPGDDAGQTAKYAWQRFDSERKRMPRGLAAEVKTPQSQQRDAQFKVAKQEMTAAFKLLPGGDKIIDLIKNENTAWVVRQDHATNLRDLLGDRFNKRPDLAHIQELQDLAKEYRSHKVIAAQPIGFLNAMVISGVLSLFFYRRRVHGAVFGMMFILYPITRFILEWVRADNPIDSGGLTISQAISVGIVPLALVYMLIIYTVLPPQSPRARIWEPPPDEPPPPGEGSTSQQVEGEPATS